MDKGRLLAFTDGVIAIIITIMVLDLKVPQDASASALATVTPVFVSYVLSFLYVAIYWNNHHHFFHLVQHVDGTLLWANLNLLFWLSLVPFTTGWMGENHFAPLPTAMYGISLLMPALSWLVMQWAIIRGHGRDATFARAMAATSRARSRPCFMPSGLPCRLSRRGRPAQRTSWSRCYGWSPTGASNVWYLGELGGREKSCNCRSGATLRGALTPGQGAIPPALSPQANRISTAARSNIVPRRD